MSTIGLKDKTRERLIDKGFIISIVLLSMLSLGIIIYAAHQSLVEGKTVLTEGEGPMETVDTPETNAPENESTPENETPKEADAPPGTESGNVNPTEVESDPNVGSAPGAVQQPFPASSAEVRSYYGPSGEPPVAPGLVMQKRTFKAEPPKIAYLTFDDGPYPDTTPRILEILEREGIRGTFFMIGTRVEAYPDLVKRVYEAGHGIGNHTYTHIYHEVYQSPNYFLRELQWTEDLFEQIIGVRPKIIRAPGGSSNFTVEYFNLLDQYGYLVYDWNASNEDTTAPLLPADQLVQNVINTSYGKNRLIILMHDIGGKTTTVEALPRIINYLREQGYEFGILSEDVMPIIFEAGFRKSLAQ